jgi:hypothetical protein
MIKTSVIFPIVCLTLLVASNANASSSEGDCDFSKYKPRRITHFAERAAIARAKPQYPLSAEAEAISGRVQIKVLINKRGLVEMTCSVPAPDSKKQDRRLITAAEAAALQWSFQPNFGIKTTGEIQFDYVEDVLTFEFVPEKHRK